MPHVTTIYYEQGIAFIPSPTDAETSLVSGTTITLSTTTSSSNASTWVGLTQTFSSTGSATSALVLPTSNVTGTIFSTLSSSSTLGKTPQSSSSRVSSSRSQTIGLPSQSLSSTDSTSLLTSPTSSLIDTSTNTIPGVSIRPYSPPCAGSEQTSGVSIVTVVINLSPPVSSFITSMPSSSSAPLRSNANTTSPPSTTSVVLSSNDPDNKTAFSRNTGAIIGVALAGGIALIVVAILTFHGCRRMRERKLRDHASSNDHLTVTAPPPLARSGSLRSPIDGDDDDFLSGAYGGILAAMQFPVSSMHHGAPGEDGSPPNGDDTETLHSQGGSTSSHGQPPGASQMKQKGRGSVVFPMIEPSAWYTGPGTPTSPTPQTVHAHDSAGMYPDSTTYRDKGKWKATESPDNRPSFIKRLRGSPSRGKNERPESLASWISYYSNPHRSTSLLNPPSLTHNRPPASQNITIKVEQPPVHPMPWLNRPASGSVKNGEAGSLASSTRSRDDSLTRVPDGLLHPLLARRLELSPVGSARSFLDNVDYSRPISGVHWHGRVDSTTTFTTQGTGEADLGHA